MTIIEFKKKEQYTEGVARCMNCHHEWHAVTPFSHYETTDWLECPECGFEKAKLKYPFSIGKEYWACNCGNDLFHISTEFIYCPNCGREQVF
jgi:DNA-directed RNA polymerase subunit RPC12/RpoP